MKTQAVEPIGEDSGVTDDGPMDVDAMVAETIRKGRRMGALECAFCSSTEGKGARVWFTVVRPSR